MRLSALALARRITAGAAFAALLLALLTALPAAAQEPAAPATDVAATGEASRLGPVRVGAPHRPPFVWQDDSESWQGLAVDLWRMTAENLGIAYEFVAVERGGAVDALSAGTIDVALAVDATPETEAIVDVLMPFYTATLAVATEQQFELWRVVQNFFSAQLLEVVLTLCVLLLVIGAIVWLLERRANTKQFHENPVLGLGDGFWWAGVTLTTIGYGDKAPVTLAGRAVAMLWMLMGLAVSAALTATVISAADIGGGTVSVPHDLMDQRVGVVATSSAEAYLTGANVEVAPFETMEAALTALTRGEVDAVAGGRPSLLAAMNAIGADFAVTVTTRDPQFVSVAVPVDAPADLKEQLRRAILSRVTSAGWWETVERYVPHADR